MLETEITANNTAYGITNLVGIQTKLGRFSLGIEDHKNVTYTFDNANSKLIIKSRTAALRTVSNDMGMFDTLSIIPYQYIEGLQYIDAADSKWVKMKSDAGVS